MQIVLSEEGRSCFCVVKLSLSGVKASGVAVV